MDFAVGAHPIDLALAKSLGAHCLAYMRDYRQAKARAEEALELSNRHQILQSASDSRIVLGYARAQFGEPAEGIALIREGIARVGSPYFPAVTVAMTFLAESLGRLGSMDEGLETVEKTLQIDRGELAFRAETLRVRGDLRRGLGMLELAEADYNEGISFARKIGARSWELRATMSLGRLLRDTNRRVEARAMLADIYNWFTEGFDTADLKEAKALLDELA